MKEVGTGTRVINFIVDSILAALLAFGAFNWWDFYVYYYGIQYIPFYYFLAAVTFLYYLFFEAIFSRTPGKWLSLSKVVNAKGAKPSFGQIIIRCAMRIIGFVIFDSILLSFKNKTLHDYVSKTNVIEIY